LQQLEFPNSNEEIDQELEQKIANTQSELEEKSAQVVTLEIEKGTLESNLIVTLGVAFMCRVEENPV